jgi:hypothetical protein
MSKRYYYTCPIKALYMMKEFKVKFCVDRSDGISGLNSYNMRTADKTKVSLEEYFKENNNDIFLIIEDSKDLAFTATKESEHIFEPKKGDLAHYDLNGGSGVYQFTNKPIRWAEGVTNIQIIRRDNKQFFMPEVEND